MIINLTETSREYFTETHGIKKSIKDPLNYKTKKLSNGLKTLYIEDPDTSYSAIALNISVGSNYDPINFLGLAHFLEHMIFMGSKKYPDESIFLKKIGNSGGISNAYTSDRSTCYFFNTPSFALLELADIFSSFFIDPLLNISSIEREVHAVNSEHQKNLLNDSWKFLQILKSSINKNHPFSKFSTGNLETLSKDVKLLQDAVRNFYNTFYSASLMTLFVYTNNIANIEKSIDEMFSKIPNKPEQYLSLPFILNINENKIEVVDFKSSDNKYRMYIIWEVPSTNEFDISLDILKYLFTRKYNGSLYDLLLKLNLIYKLSFESLVNYVNSQIIILKLSLTHEGASNYITIIDIIKSFINYITSLNKEIYKLIYDELCILNRIDFINHTKKQSIDYLLELISNINSFSIDIEKSLIFRLYCQNFTNTYIKILKLLKSMRNFLVIKSQKNFSFDNYDIEPYYNTPYKSQQLTFKESNSYSFQFPSKNRYIPSSVVLVKETKPFKHPFDVTSLFVNDSTCKHKYYIDFNNEFLSLNSALYLDIVLPTIFYDDTFTKIDKFIAINLYILCIKREFQYILNDIDVAGYDIYFEFLNDKIRINIIGLNENFLRVCIKILEILFTCKSRNVDRSTYNYAYEIFKNDLDNFKFRQPYQKLYDILLSKLSPFYISIESLIDYLKLNKQIYENINRICNLLFSNCWVKCIFGGNIYLTKKHIAGFINYLNDNLNSYQGIYIKRLNLTQKHTELIVKNSNPDDKNIALQYMVKLDSIVDKKTVDWDKKLCCSLLLNNLASSLYFDILRTKMKLGYIVTVKIDSINNDPNYKEYYMLFIIQSSNSTLKILINETVLFIDKLRKNIEELSDEIFKHLKDSLKKSLLQPDSNLYEKLSKDQENILKDKPYFDKHEILAKSLDTVNKDYFVKQFTSQFYTHKQTIIVGIN